MPLVPTPEPERIAADIVVLGSGAAGLMAVRHARLADRALRVMLVSKGLVGRSGCSIMAQGMNAAMGADDDPATHFADVVRGGEFVGDQALAWALASDAPEVIRELSDELGCAFDRGPDGAIRLSPFAGQSKLRKVSHGHLTGLEIINRLRDDLARTRPRQLPDVRALDLLVDDAGVCGVLLLDVRRGVPIVVEAPAVVLASGGSAAASYRVATPAREKAGDGLAMALRAGLPLRDMEFVQFLSVGVAAAGSKVTGTLLEEAMRFAGAVLRNADGEAFMARYHPAGDKAPRDAVARASFEEILDGRGTPEGGVLLDCTAIGAEALAARFGDLVERAALTGRDLATTPIPVAPAAHIGIGGIPIDDTTRTALPGLLAAGEDAGGTHGASWAGGNGIAESTVFGRRAGRTAALVSRERANVRGVPTDAAIGAAVARAFAPLAGDGPGAAARGEAGASAASSPSPAALTDELRRVMWERVGLRRDAPGLTAAAAAVVELRERAALARVSGGPAANGAWQDALDLHSRLAVCEAVVASATARTETRGVHVRADHPATDPAWLRTVLVRGLPGALTVETAPVALDRLAPGTLA